MTHRALRISTFSTLFLLGGAVHAQSTAGHAVAPSTSPAALPASPAASACAPECRTGFVCVQAQCVSACNPACGPSEVCTTAGECVARTPAAQPAPPSPPTMVASTTPSAPPSPLPQAPASPAAAEGATPSNAPESHRGLSFGMRTGYSLVSGNAMQNDPLSNEYSGAIPIWFDAGYLANPHLLVGAYFQYGFGFVPSGGQGLCPQGADCSAHVARFGGEFQYRFQPQAAWDPWLGAGFGYEWNSASVSTTSGGKTATQSGEADGFELLNLQVGLDYQAAPGFGVGPFLAMSLGEYTNLTETSTSGSQTSGSIPNTAMHEWFFLGLRGVYDVSLQ